MKDFFKSNYQHFVAVAIFFILIFVYFSPQFGGQSLKQHDVEQYIGSAHEAYYFKDKTGTEQLWTNSMFGGMPTTQTSLIHPGNFLGRAVMNFVNWLPSPSGMVLLHMLCFYIMLLCFRVNRWIAIVGAVAFAFVSYEIIILQAGHNSKSLAVAFMAPVVGGFFMAYRYKSWLGVGLSALFMALQLSCNHLQVSYYMVILLVGLGIAEFVRVFMTKEFKKFTFVTFGLIGAYLLAAAVNYGNISMTNDYAKDTIRGGNDLELTPTGEKNVISTKGGLDKEYITNWSYGIGESFTLISPYVKGGGTIIFADSPHADIVENMELTSEERKQLLGYPVYWGEQPMTSGPVYVGVVLCLLAFMGMFFIKDPTKWALLGVSILALMLSWGKNYMGLTDFFLDNVPGYNKFRTVTIILVIIELTIPLLAVLFLQKLYKEREALKQAPKKMLYVGGGFILFLFIVKFVGLGDNYASQEFDQKQLARIEEQILGQLTQADPAMIQQQFNVNIADPVQREGFIAEQMKPYEENLNNAKNARKAVYDSSMNRSILFSVLSLGLIALLLFSSVPTMAVIGGFGVLILIDLLGVSSNYLNKDEKYWVDAVAKAYPFNSEAADEDIMRMELEQNPSLNAVVQKGEQEGKRVANELEAEGETKRRIINSYRFSALNEATNYKVFDLSSGFSSARPSYFHKSLGGYHGAKLRTIQNLFEFHLSRTNNAVYNMLNVKYFIQPTETSLIARANPEALGNAWFVNELKVVNTRDEEINALGKIFSLKNSGTGELLINNQKANEKDVYGYETITYFMNGDSISVQLSNGVTKGMLVHVVLDVNGKVNTVPDYVMQNDTAAKSFQKIVSYEVLSDFNPKTTAVASAKNIEGISKRKFTGEGEIKLTNYSPMELSYNANSSNGGLAVFSELFYKNWKATVDGKEVPVYNVNYCLRAIELTKGNHKVVFTYDSSDFDSSNKISLLLCLLVLVLLGFTIYMQIKQDKKLSEPK
jgi:hypothetical protein